MARESMMKYCLQTFAILFLVTLVFLGGCDREKKRPQVVKGVLNLTDWNFGNDGIVALDGEWEFYWSRLLNPKDFANRDQPSKSGHIQFPGRWEGYEIHGKKLGVKGYATFRLLVEFSRDSTIKTLKVIRGIPSASRIWINGEPTNWNGIVGTSKGLSKAAVSSHFTSFQPVSGINEIIVQVSRFHELKLQPESAISIGNSTDIDNEHLRETILDLLIVGGIFVIGIYHITIFLFRRRGMAKMHFGIICFLFSCEFLFHNRGGNFIAFFFPSLSFEWLCKLEILPSYAAVPFLLTFFNSLFPGEFSRKMILLIQVLGIIFCTIILVSTEEIFSLTINPYLIISVFFGGYATVIIVRALKRKREGAGFVLVGFTIFFLCTLNDILNIEEVIHSFPIFRIGFFVFAFFQSLALSYQYSKVNEAKELLTASLEEKARELEIKNIDLSRLDKLKDEFLANTSHELRTPLNGIIGITDSLLQGAAGGISASVSKNLALVVSSAKRLSGLINDSLDYSKLENSDLILKRKAVDIRSIVETVLNISQQLILGEEITLLNKIPHNINYVNGDENRLQQILYNLVGNAIKFTNQGQISVVGKEKGDLLELSVSDTGVGIPEESFESIFKSFEQGQHSNERVSEGTGLGLSITRKLIELHQGKIWVESQPGKGSTFFFTLPLLNQKHPIDSNPTMQNTDEIALAYPKPVEQIAPQHIESSVRFDSQEENIQVLVVDDEAVNLQVAANFLALEQIRFDLVSNGNKLIQRVTNGQKPDLVLLDIMMPEMTGYEACRILRREYSSSELPIIMVTAKNRVNDLVEGFEAGANDYLTKPYSKDELIARVRSQLIIKQAYETLEQNIRLKEEIKKRKQNEQHLLMLQRKLSDMLDTVPDPMIAIDENNRISFFNQPFLSKTGQENQDLLGKPYLDVFKEDSGKMLNELQGNLSGDALPPGTTRHYHKLLLRRSKQKSLRVDVLATSLDVGENQLVVLLFRPELQASPDAFIENSLAFFKEFNQNRARLQSLEENLNLITSKTLQQRPELVSNLEVIDGALEKMGKDLEKRNKQSGLRQQVVSAMKLATSDWLEDTGTSKTELAKSSKIWKVNIDRDGWARARTLEKYLDITSCPQKPRLEHVINTIYFVLANCSTPSEQRVQLEESLSQLKQI